MTIRDDMTRQYASRVNREPYLVILANDKTFICCDNFSDRSKYGSKVDVSRTVLNAAVSCNEGQICNRHTFPSTSLEAAYSTR